MTEDELKAIEADAFCAAGISPSWCGRLHRVTNAVRSLTTQLAVAQGSVTAETHRAEVAEARVERLERQALADAQTIREWADTAKALRVQESRISGTLMDSGITFESVPEGVAALLADRDMAKEGT